MRFADSSKFRFVPVLIGIFALCCAASSQVKVDEFQRTDSDSELARLENFLEQLRSEPETTGVVEVYIGTNSDHVDEALRDIGGIKEEVSIWLKSPLVSRINFVGAKKNPPLYKVFWLVKSQVSNSFASEELISLDTLKELSRSNLINLTKPYLFAVSCLECEPVAPGLSQDRIDFERYAELLRQFPKYQAVIKISSASRLKKSRSYQSAVAYGARFRERLKHEYGVGNEISLIITFKPEKYGLMVARLYIQLVNET